MTIHYLRDYYSVALCCFERTSQTKKAQFFSRLAAVASRASSDRTDQFGPHGLIDVVAELPSPQKIIFFFHHRRPRRRTVARCRFRRLLVRPG